MGTGRLRQGQNPSPLLLLLEFLSRARFLSVTTATLSTARGQQPAPPCACVLILLLSIFFATVVSGQGTTAPAEPPKDGGLFQKALGQVAKKENARDIADKLLQSIRENGHDVLFGEPEIQASIQNPNRIDLILPVSLQASDAIKEELEETARSWDGLVKPASYERRGGMVVQISKDPEILEYFHRRVAGLVFMVQLSLNDGSVLRCYDENEARNALRNPIVPVRLMWSTPKENRIVGLGVNPALAKAAGSRTPGLDRGSIAVFDEPITFQVRFTIPLESAKSIEYVEGTFLQWRLTELDAYSIDRATLALRSPCSVSPAER